VERDVASLYSLLHANIAIVCLNLTSVLESIVRARAIESARASGLKVDLSSFLQVIKPLVTVFSEYVSSLGLLVISELT
jgi:hypothetical protein